MNDQTGDWETHQKIVVILAHPDDPDFFCGATLARWALAGHDIHYILLTCGERGGSMDFTPTELCNARNSEQQKAVEIIGAKSVQFLNYEDGYLVPNLELRREIVRHIRREKPDILVTCDPTNIFPFSGYGLNHPDHRAAGQVVLDAVFPAAGNVHFFPELLSTEGLEPHTPREVWISLASEPTVILDVTAFWEIKLRALKQHKSQIGDPVKFEARMRSRHTEDSTDEKPRYEEKFRVVKFRLH
jgi:LmbE family N-acetylglucosaminyl deacetylase